MDEHPEHDVIMMKPDLNTPYILAVCTKTKVKVLNPGGREIFRSGPERPWGSAILLNNGNLVSFPGGGGGKKGLAGVLHSPSFLGRG